MNKYQIATLVAITAGTLLIVFNPFRATANQYDVQVAQINAAKELQLAQIKVKRREQYPACAESVTKQLPADYVNTHSNDAYSALLAQVCN